MKMPHLRGFWLVDAYHETLPRKLASGLHDIQGLCAHTSYEAGIFRLRVVRLRFVRACPPRVHEFSSMFPDKRGSQRKETKLGMLGSEAESLTREVQAADLAIGALPPA